MKIIAVLGLVISSVVMLLGHETRHTPTLLDYEEYVSLQDRAHTLADNLDDINQIYYTEVVPIYVDLLSTGRVRNIDTALSTAIFVRKYSQQYDLNPFLVSAVIKVENPWLVSDTASFAGAVGLMQVMPTIWGEEFPECGEDLLNPETNICKGVRILKSYMEREFRTALDRALLRYNGCVNTVGCESYTQKVLGDRL